MSDDRPTAENDAGVSMSLSKGHTAEKDAATLQDSQTWATFNHNTPEAFWDVATWADGAWSPGSLDVADRKRIVLAVLAATRPIPPGSCEETP